MDYWIEKRTDTTGFTVLAGDRLTYAETTNLRDAALARQSICFLEDLVEEFPGLVDGETETPGADLVDFICLKFGRYKTLSAYLSGDAKYKNDEEIPEVTRETYTHEPKRPRRSSKLEGQELAKRVHKRGRNLRNPS